MRDTIIAVLLFIAAAFLFVRALKPHKKVGPVINYSQDLRKDENSPNSLNYAFKKLTTSKKMRELKVLSPINRAPKSAISADDLIQKIKANPDTAMATIRKLTSDPDELPVSDKRAILDALTYFQYNSDASEVAQAIYQSHMKQNRFKDPATDLQLRETTLNVIFNTDQEGASALEDMFKLVEDEHDPSLRFKMFRAYAKRFPGYRPALRERLDQTDIRYAEEIQRTKRNR